MLWGGEYFQMKAFFHALLPNLQKIRCEKWYILTVQIMVAIVLSVENTIQKAQRMNPLLIFVISFLSYMWLIDMIVNILKWLQEYLRRMSITMGMTIVVPVVILLCFEYVDTGIERRISFIALILSVVFTYLEMLAFITDTQEEKESLEQMTKDLKVKSIITWLVVILLNLYTLVILVQFNASHHVKHFINATTYGKAAAIDLFYYVIITFSTVGFGDICPKTQLAKLLTGFIALSGMLFSGVFVATIIASQRRNK